MREAREKRWHDAVREDLRHLGLLMVLAGVVGFFFEPSLAHSAGLVALGLVVWGGSVYYFYLRKSQTQSKSKPKPKRTRRRKS